MKERLKAFGTVFLIVIAAFVGLIIVNTNMVSAQATLYVGGGGPGNYTTIQDAIIACNDGDTVFVYNGTYIENVVVNKTINLTGEDKDTTIIDGGGSGDVVIISADWVNMTGFTVSGGGGNANDGGIELSNVVNCYVANNNVSNNNRDGIRILNTDDNIIENNNISNNGDEGIHMESSFRNDVIGNYVFNNGLQNNQGDGVLVYNSGENKVVNNNVSGNDNGIDIYNSNVNNITGNNVSSNNGNGIIVENSNENILTGNIISDHYYGIYLFVSVGNNLTLNSLKNDGIFISGNMLEYWNTHHIEISNLVNGGSVYYWKNQTGGSIPLGAGEVILANCTNVDVNNQVLDNCSVGIEMGFSWNNNVTNNDVMNCSDGIFLYSSDENIIDNNNVNLNNNGIYIETSDFNEITNNSLENNSNYGIYARFISNTNITDNNVTNNYYGVYFRDSSDVNVTNNTVFTNYWGIYIRSSTESNLTQNNISNNEIGIYIRDSDFINISFNELYSNGENGIYINGRSFQNWVIGNTITDSYAGIALFPRFMWRPSDNYIIDNSISYSELGIHLNNVPTNTLSNNTMSFCGIFIEGDRLSSWNTHEIDIKNTVNGKPVYYWKDQTGGGIPGDAGEVILANCSGVFVVSLELSNGSVGIELGYSSSNILADNDISANNWGGIYLWDSDQNEILLNTISSHDQYGIRSDSFCSDNNITENNFNNNYYSLFMEFSPINYIEDNDIFNSNYGIYLFGSDDNTIDDNNVSYNDYGVYLNLSDGNDVFRNEIYSNNIYGIYLVESSNGIIYHNNIIDNLNQAFDDSFEGNIWNLTYPGGGNYWSDFSPICPDLFSGAQTPQTNGSPDGICDFQYDIDDNSTDYYPLKGLWNPSFNPPSGPLNLTATGGITYVNVTWDVPISDGGLPIYGYRIYRGNTSGGETFYMEIENILYFNDTMVIGGIEYYYRVSAINILGEGSLSNEDNATPLSPPDAPTIIGYTTGDSYVNLSWTPPTLDGGSPIVMYNIYRNDTPGIYANVSVDQLWYNDTGAINGVNYTYNISAVNAIGEGPLSIGISVIPMTIPLAPENLGLDAGDEFINLTWLSPLDNGGSAIIEYHIYRDDIVGVYATVSSNQRWFNDTGLTNGVTYNYNVSAVNIVGEGPSLSISGIPVTIPSAPESPQASAGNEYVNLSWMPPSDSGGSAITGYNIYRDDVGGIYATALGNQLWYNDTGVSNGILYLYYLSALNDVGEGEFSIWVTATPGSVPTEPLNLQATYGDGYVYLTWVAPFDNGGFPITGYNIYREGETGVFESVSAGQLFYNDTSVTNGVTYTYYVSAVNGVGEGDLSTGASATPMTVPSAVQNFSVETGDGFVNLTWEAPAFDGGSTIIGYYIYRNGTMVIYDTVSVGQQWFYDDNLVNGITYTYQVSAYNIVGEGPYSDVENAIPGDIPSVPTNLNAQEGDSFVYLTWGIPDSNGGFPITNYRIFRGNISGSEVEIAEIGDSPFYNDTNVTNDVIYYYFVIAVNDIGDGLASEVVNATPKASAVPENQLPTISIESPLSGAKVNGTTVISGSASDIDGTVQKVEIKINDGTWMEVEGTTSWSFGLDTTTLSNGDRTITVRSFDGTNYSLETSITIEVDNPIEEAEEEEDQTWLLLLVIIIIVIVVLLLFFLLGKRRKPKEEPKKEEGAKEIEKEAEGATEEKEEITEEPEKETEELTDKKEEVAEETEKGKEDEIEDKKETGAVDSETEIESKAEEEDIEGELKKEESSAKDDFKEEELPSPEDFDEEGLPPPDD